MRSVKLSRKSLSKQTWMNRFSEEFCGRDQYDVLVIFEEFAWQINESQGYVIWDIDNEILDIDDDRLDIGYVLSVMFPKMLEEQFNETVCDVRQNLNFYKL